MTERRPPSAYDRAVKLLARRASAVMTNVPGPRAPLRFAGAVMDGVMFWVPQSGRLGLGVSVLSYAGQVRVGVAADERVVPDPSAIVVHFHDALDDLVAEVDRIFQTEDQHGRL